MTVHSSRSGNKLKHACISNVSIVCRHGRQDCNSDNMPLGRNSVPCQLGVLIATRPSDVVVGVTYVLRRFFVFYVSFIVSYPRSSLNETQPKPATCSDGQQDTSPTRQFAYCTPRSLRTYTVIQCVHSKNCVITVEDPARQGMQAKCPKMCRRTVS